MDDKISFDFNKYGNWIKKYYLIFLLLIPILLSIVFRAMPFYLPITDAWAEDTLNNNIMSSLEKQINQQYPNLPDIQKQDFIDKEYQNFIDENSEAYKQQIQSLSKQFKDAMQDENGQTYLCAIDPYLWFGYSKNYIKYGHFGNAYKDDQPWYTLRNGRIGQKVSIPFNSLMTVILYKIVHFFNKDFSLLTAAFLIPLIITTLGVIPVFFIVRRFAGNIGALFAAILFAVSPALISRTVAGFSDTDPYAVVFPIFVLWFFIESFFAKSKTKQYLLLSLSGGLLGLLSYAWGSGWWYSFDFILVTMGSYLIFSIIKNIKEIKNNFLSLFKLKAFKQFIETIIIIPSSFLIIVTMLTPIYYSKWYIGFQYLYNALIQQPLWFINIKSVGVSTIWPNVLTTVAELNPSSYGNVINALGGTYMFLLGIIGLFILMYKSKDIQSNFFKFSIFMIIWFFASFFAAVTSLRFVEIMVPVYSILFGITIGFAFNLLTTLSEQIMVNKKILNVVVILFFSLFLLSPIITGYKTVKNEVPSYNDVWDKTLKEIQYESDDAIISSWWDFGHWFVAMSERRVTFDGGDQGLRINFLGKILSTKNETEAINILRMLNCGQEEAYKTLYAYEKNNDSNSQKEYNAITTLNKIISLDKDEAYIYLINDNYSDNEITQILNYTHCEDLIDQYFITSEDMVGKSGVWAHFGTWDFDRALVYNVARKMNYNDGIKYIINNLNVEKNEASKMYYEIKEQSGDKWIADWPSYQSNLLNCDVDNNIAYCENLIIDLIKYEAYAKSPDGNQYMYSVVYVDNNNIKENIRNISQLDYTIGLIPNGEKYFALIMHPDLSTSMFTRLYFYNGIGLEHFKLFSDKTTFTGLNIKTWKVNLEEI